MKFEINLIAGVIVLLAVITGLTLGGRALYHAGYNARVADDSKAFASAEAQGAKAQKDADEAAMKQMQDALNDAQRADRDRDARLTALTHDNNALARRLHDLSQSSPDAARWLAEPLPCPILHSVFGAAACPSATPASPGH